MPTTAETTSASGRPKSVGGEGVLGVHDAVAVALLGQEALSVGGELGVHGVPGDHGVEAGGHSGGLRSQQPAEPLRLLLP